MKVDKDTIIGEILADNYKAAEVFYSMGMFCVSCPASTMESVEEACDVHGLDAEEMVDRLNAFFEQAGQETHA